MRLLPTDVESASSGGLAGLGSQLSEHLARPEHVVSGAERGGGEFVDPAVTEAFDTRTHRRVVAATGAVITSAGILLAAVFAVLGGLPLITLTQIGVIVCVGVLIDTLLGRTVTVPAMAFIAKDRFWWPRKPSLTDAQAPGARCGCLGSRGVRAGDSGRDRQLDKRIR